MPRPRGHAGGPAVNWMLVQPGPLWRAPVRIDARPELGAAFERGRRARLSGRARRGEATSPERLDELMGLGEDERAAYLLGLQAPDVVRAPAAAWLAVPAVGLTAAAELLARAPAPRRAKLFRISASIGVGLMVQPLAGWGERRRARQLGLTVTGAPRAAVLEQLVALTLAFAYSGWRRLRDGRWPRSDPSSVVAASIVREFRRRRDWNAVHARLTAD